MAANTVLNYLPRQSVVHKMTGTTKLAFFLLFTFASMITYNTWVLLGLMAVSFAAFKLSHIKLREVRFMMIFMLVFLLLNNLFIFLFDPNQGTTLYGTRHVLFHLFWRYDVTAEQLFYMVNITLKYFVALPVAILFISATNPSEFAASLNSIGISYKVGYSVAIALRYIPDIQRDYHSISQAQQARGVELGKSEPFFARLKNSVSILLPLILTSLNRIDTISNAMELRGFGKNGKRTWYTQRPFAKRDFAALALGAALLLVSLFPRQCDRYIVGRGAGGAVCSAVTPERRGPDENFDPHRSRRSGGCDRGGSLGGTGSGSCFRSGHQQYQLHCR
jgi:energy-coupling factor transport system permease protein